MLTNNRTKVRAGADAGDAPGIQSIRAAFVPPENPEPTGDAATFAAAAMALTETYDTQAYIDTRLQMDIDSIKTYCARSGADVVSVTDGNWSSNSTWYNVNSETQVKPAAGDKVLIALGTTVTYDEDSTTEYDWIRSDGTFRFDISADRNLRIDTFFVDHTGHYEEGTAASPVPSNVTIRVEFPDNGDLDVTNDGFKLQRGLICFGTAEVEGASKKAFSRTTEGLTSGATSFTLRDTPTGWAVGDTIVITGTNWTAWDDSRLGGAQYEWQGPGLHETATISNISGNTITISSGLSNNHPACHLVKGLDYDAESTAFTRGATLTGGTSGATATIDRITDNGDGTGSLLLYGVTGTFQDNETITDGDGGSATVNGTVWGGLTPHVANLTRNIYFGPPSGDDPIYKHRAHLLFKNRISAKLKWALAYKMGRTSHNGNDETIVPDFHTEQYSGHYRGPVDIMKYKAAGGTITADTNTTGRYSWHIHRNGFDDPNSNPTIFEGLVAWDNPGWAFVHHDSHANITDCVAYKTAQGFTAEGGGNFGTWDGNIAIESNRYETESFTRGTNFIKGHFDAFGFWFNGRAVKIKNCVSSGARCGFGWGSRISFDTDVYPGVMDEIRLFYGLAELPGTTVGKNFANIQQFENCESYNVEWGAAIAKSQPQQGHTGRSIFTNFVAWEVANDGFHVQYTGHYSQVNFNLYGMDSSLRPGRPNSAQRGVDMNSNSIDIVTIRPVIRDFQSVLVEKEEHATNGLNNNRHKFIVAPIYSGEDKFFALHTSGEVKTLPYDYDDGAGGHSADVIQLNAGDIDPPPGGGNITFAWDEDQMIWDASGNGAFVILGDYTDSVGTISRVSGCMSEKADNKNATDSLEVKTQADIDDWTLSNSSWGALTVCSRLQMEEMIKANGVYTSTAGDKVLLIPDIIEDRQDGTPTYFFTPVAIRISTSYFNSLNPADNGALADGVGEAYEGFDPAGTNGLT